MLDPITFFLDRKFTFIKYLYGQKECPSLFHFFAHVKGWEFFSSSFEICKC